MQIQEGLNAMMNDVANGENLTAVQIGVDAYESALPHELDFMDGVLTFVGGDRVDVSRCHHQSATYDPVGFTVTESRLSINLNPICKSGEPNKIKFEMYNDSLLLKVLEIAYIAPLLKPTVTIIESVDHNVRLQIMPDITGFLPELPVANIARIAIGAGGVDISNDNPDRSWNFSWLNRFANGYDQDITFQLLLENGSYGIQSPLCDPVTFHSPIELPQSFHRLVVSVIDETDESDMALDAKVYADGPDPESLVIETFVGFDKVAEDVVLPKITNQWFSVRAHTQDGVIRSRECSMPSQLIMPGKVLTATASNGVTLFSSDNANGYELKRQGEDWREVVNSQAELLPGQYQVRGRFTVANSNAVAYGPINDFGISLND